MEKYEKYLSKDEKLKIVTGYSQIHLREDWLTHAIIPGAIFIIAGIGIFYFKHLDLRIGVLIGFIIDSFFSLVLVVITDKSHKYFLTTRRVIVKEGFFKIKLASILYDKITHITVDQFFLERVILGYGTIVIDTAGSSGDELVLKYVANPIKFKNTLENLIHKHRSSKYQTSKKQENSLHPNKKLLRPFEKDFIDFNKRSN